MLIVTTRTVITIELFQSDENLKLPSLVIPPMSGTKSFSFQIDTLDFCSPNHIAGRPRKLHTKQLHQTLVRLNVFPKIIVQSECSLESRKDAFEFCSYLQLTEINQIYQFESRLLHNQQRMCKTVGSLSKLHNVELYIKHFR